MKKLTRTITQMLRAAVRSAMEEWQLGATTESRSNSVQSRSKAAA